MICQVCGVEAPTRHITMYRNIGLLVMRLSETTDANVCKPCLHGTFWKYTAINMTLGWWGVISFIVTPFFMINNVVYYLMNLGMESPAPNASSPQINQAVWDAIEPHTDYLIQRMSAGHDFRAVSEDVAMRAGVTPGQVALFVQTLIAHQQASRV
jgi:hypothetical protein